MGKSSRKQDEVLKFGNPLVDDDDDDDDGPSAGSHGSRSTAEAAGDALPAQPDEGGRHGSRSPAEAAGDALPAQPDEDRRDPQHDANGALALRLADSPSFNNGVLLLILASCTCLALEDPLEDDNAPSTSGETLKRLELWFTAGFMLEIAIKLVAYGPAGYIRSWWNVLDVVIVGSSIVSIASEGRLPGLRAFRLLRPLRSINRLPGLRMLVSTLVAAIPQFGGMVNLLGTFFIVFGITGVNLWEGRWRMRCDSGEMPLEEVLAAVNSPRTEYCDADKCETGVGCLCSAANDTCAVQGTNPFEWIDTREERSTNTTDIMSFDSVPHSIPVMLHLVTLASWQQLMAITELTSGTYVRVYFIAAVLLGAYFMMNLFVAILKDKFFVSNAVATEGLAAFQSIDVDGDGSLMIEEVGRIFLLHGVYLSEEELRAAFQDMSRGCDAADLNQFLFWLRGDSLFATKLRTSLQIDGAQNDFVEDDAALDEADMVASAKRKLTRLADVGGAVDWTVLFSYYDNDGSCELDFDEFKKALRRDAHISPKHMTDVEMRALFDTVDVDRAGTVCLAEWAAWLKPEEKPATMEEETKDEVLAVITSATCHTLTIADSPEGEIDVAQVRAALGAEDELVSKFAFGRGERRLYVNWQPVIDDPEQWRWWHRVKGPELVTVTQECPVPMVGFSMEFKTKSDLLAVHTRSKAENHRHSRQSRSVFRRNRHHKHVVPGVPAKILFKEAVGLTGWRMQVRQQILAAAWFKWGFAGAVVLNIACLCVDHHGISAELEQATEIASHAFTLLFALEVGLKMSGQSMREFWTDAFQVFEFSIVIVGMVEIIAAVGECGTAAEASWCLGSGGTKTFRGFMICRALRVLRVLRLVTALKSMRTVVDVMVLCLWDLGYVLLLIFIFLYMYACLGMQIFGGELLDASGESPRGNWDEFVLAIFTTFQIMTLDGWNGIMYEVARRKGPFASLLYFGSWIVIGTWILSNLLLVAIVEAYGKTEERVLFHEHQLQIEEEKQGEWDGTSESEIAPETENKVGSEQRSESKSATPRQEKARALVDHILFDPVLMMVVLLNCVVVALDKPWLDEGDSDRLIVQWASPAFTAVFMMEMGVRCFAYGVTGHKRAFLDPQNPVAPWNKLDAVILVSSVLDHVAETLQLAGGDGRFFRLTRAFRALRILSKVTGLQVLVVSIVRSFLALTSVMGVTLLSWLVFGLTTVTFLKGRLYFCRDDGPEIVGASTCVGSYVVEAPGGQSTISERSWAAPYVHFDDIGMAMYTLFEMSSLSDWVVVARSAMDHTDVNKQPSENANRLWAPFFMLFIIVNNFFLLNLFIGVIYTKYLQAMYHGIGDLTQKQRNWLLTMQSIVWERPQKTYAPSTAGRAQAYKIAQSQTFERIMMGVIVFNVCVLSLKHHGESEFSTFVQDRLNDLCTVAFTLEAALKIWAFSFPKYLVESWNRFDFAVVVVSWLDIAVRATNLDEHISPTPFRLLRIVRVIGRIGRLFKMSKKLKSMKMIFDTFVEALPKMGHVVLMITVVLYIFGVVGMNLFGRVQRQQCLTSATNFETVPTAMLTLLGAATGDGFTCLVHSTMVQESGKSYAVKGACSETDGTCGEPRNARLFFILFSLIITFTSMELFVNVVLDQFERLTKMKGSSITLDDLERFVAAWAKIDHEATGEIKVNELPKLLDRLQEDVRAIGYEERAGEEPISLHDLRLPERPGGTHSRYLVTGTQDEADGPYVFVDPKKPMADAPDSATVRFIELLYGLCERKCGCPMPRDNEIIEEARRQLGVQMPTVEHLFRSEDWLTRHSRAQSEPSVGDRGVVGQKIGTASADGVAPVAALEDPTDLPME